MIQEPGIEDKLQIKSILYLMIYISHCLSLTQEFMHLTEWHTNQDWEESLRIMSPVFLSHEDEHEQKYK